MIPSINPNTDAETTLKRSCNCACPSNCCKGWFRRVNHDDHSISASQEIEKVKDVSNDRFAYFDPSRTPWNSIYTDDESEDRFYETRIFKKKSELRKSTSMEIYKEKSDDTERT